MTRAAIVMIAFSGAAAVGADVTDQELASWLARDSLRQAALSRIVSSPASSKIPLLLRWTRNPPHDVDQYELFVGLADAFGQLKVKEAIPFLIKNIHLDRTRSVNTWLKAPEIIEQRMAAVASLIKMGSAAYDPLLRASWEPTVFEDRIAIIFALSRIVSTTRNPDARSFFTSTLGEANMERYWATEALKALDERR